MLTELQCKNAKCQEGQKPARFKDGNGLFLQVDAAGRKRWFLSLRVDGVPTRMALGKYSEVSLKEARAKAAELKAKKARGVNPIAERREKKRQQVRGATLAEVAEKWLAVKAAQLKDGGKGVRGRVERFLLPALGRRVMASIETRELKKVIESILDDSEKERRETAHKVLGYARQIWSYGVLEEHVKVNIVIPLTDALRDWLPAPEVTHYAAVTTPEDLVPVLRAIREPGRRGTPWVWTALQLMPMLFLRQINIRGMRWERIDWKAATLTIPRAEMKTQQADFPFICPLPRQALALLEVLRPITDTPGQGGWCFPNQQTPSKAPISEAALPGALKRRGIPPEEQMMHGFRATARTILAELGFPKDAIEAQLDHAVSDANGRAYNRTQFLPQRQEMLQRWADYLDALHDGGAEAGAALLEQWKAEGAVKASLLG